MLKFARYFIEFLRTLWANIVAFFSSIGRAFGKFFGTDIVRYFQYFFQQSPEFDFLDWLAAVIVFLVNFGFIVFLFIWIFQGLRRFFRFRKREVEKDDLIQEITTLSQQNLILTNEKNEILKLKMETFGLNPDLYLGGDEAPKKKIDSRFTKLIAIDNQYKLTSIKTKMNPVDMITLDELVDRFINFSAYKLKLYYSHDVIRSFFAGMGATKILILEGISGTGKTSLPYAMGQFFTHSASIIPVQPSWRDRTEMIGYLNEFTKRFNETDFLRDLYEVNYRDDISFIVLDEMNLARVEYYFADFLSIMEMPEKEDWLIDIVPKSEDGDPEKLKNGKLTVPQNIWFVGTANKDDSTFTISDKVYDRAASIEMDTKAEYFDAPETNSLVMTYDYINNLFEEAIKQHPISKENLINIKKLDMFITEKFKITFGNRIMNQIQHYVPIYVACGGTENEALDDIITRKIFRKFEALNLPFLQQELDELQVFLNKSFGRNEFKEGLAYIERLKRFI